MKKMVQALVDFPATFLGKLAGYDDLTGLHDEWIKLAWDTSEPIGIRAFRGSYKTSAVVILGAIRYLLINPDKRILLIRKTQLSDAAPTLGAISKLIKSKNIWGIFQTFYPGIRILEDTKTRFRLSTLPDGVKESSVMAFGIGDSITGTHADVILTDDILNIKDRVSAAEREKTRQSFFELQNIADDGAKQIFNGTVWHERDVWQDIEKIAKVYDYPASKYWNQLFEPQGLQERKDSLPATLFAINYELTFLKDESLMFINIRYAKQGITYDTWKTDRIYAQLDAGYRGTDTTALTLIAGDIVRGWVWRKHVDDCLIEINSICQNYSVAQGFIELNSDKGYVLRDLQEAGATSWEGYWEKMNKVVKISVVLKAYWSRIQFDKATDLAYIEQISDWKEDTTGNDDAPDSLASLLHKINAGGRIMAISKTAFGL